MAVQSYYHELALPEIPADEYVIQHFGKYGDRIALIDNESGVQLSYSTLDEQIRSLAAALQMSGVKKGDVVGICCRNCVQYPVLLLASVACDATLTMLSPRNSKNEMLHRLRISQPSVLFVDKESAATLEFLREELACLKKVFIVDQNFEAGKVKNVREGDQENDPGNVKSDLERDVAFIFYSSGTTGLEKGVALSHKNMVSSLHIFSNHFKLFPSDCCYTDRVMGHGYGILVLLSCLRAGATLLFENRPCVDRIPLVIEKYKVTHMATAPSLLTGLAQRSGEKHYASSLRRILYGGSLLPPSLISALEKRYKVIVSSVYGATECAPIAMSDPIHYSIASVGMVPANSAIKIVDLNTGAVVPQVQDGEIMIKGPQVALGYHQNASATAESFEDGWLRTGDLGHFDENEMLHVVGRLKEMIKYNGMQVPPAEVEAVLLTHPGIADAAVIGIPDAKAGEVPKAFVVRKDDMLKAEDVKRCVEGNLADWKHLRGGVEFIQAIPINKNGKIDRLELRRRHES